MHHLLFMIDLILSQQLFLIFQILICKSQLRSNTSLRNSFTMKATDQYGTALT